MLDCARHLYRWVLRLCREEGIEESRREDGGDRISKLNITLTPGMHEAQTCYQIRLANASVSRAGVRVTMWGWATSGGLGRSRNNGGRGLWT
jgi:hypothetical protein